MITAQDVARRVIDAQDMERWIGFLASDELRGRGTPSRGLARAASWVAEHFQLAGLEPAGDDGGYVQYWPVGPDTLRAPNVVGYRPGSDLTRAGEYVVVVAHLDHLGVGEPDASGDSIYNGADDNATGVAALVEIAAALDALPRRTVRPVVLVGVSGREGGVRGSRWFVDHGPVDLTGAVAVLNMDMIGRNHPDTVVVFGADGPEAEGGDGSLLDRVARVAESAPRLGLTVVRGDDGGPGSGGGSEGQGALPAFPTDHTPFAEAGLPAVTISTGTHADYHRPSDHAGRVDADKAARIARLVFLTAHALATAESGG